MSNNNSSTNNNNNNNSNNNSSHNQNNIITSNINVNNSPYSCSISYNNNIIKYKDNNRGGTFILNGPLEHFSVTADGIAIRTATDNLSIGQGGVLYESFAGINTNNNTPHSINNNNNHINNNIKKHMTPNTTTNNTNSDYHYSFNYSSTSSFGPLLNMSTPTKKFSIGPGGIFFDSSQPKNNNNNNNSTNNLSITSSNGNLHTRTYADKPSVGAQGGSLVNSLVCNSTYPIFAASALAGSLGGTFTPTFFGAPYRRVETLLQINNHLASTNQITRPYTGVVDILKSIRSRRGLFGYWRGGVPYMLGTLLTSPSNSFRGAFGSFFTGLALSRTKNSSASEQPPYTTLTRDLYLAGSSATLLTPLFYPLHLFNTKMAADVQKFPTFRRTRFDVRRYGALRGWFRGLPAFMMSRIITTGGLGAIAEGTAFLLNNDNNNNNEKSNKTKKFQKNVPTTTHTLVLIHLWAFSCLTAATYLSSPFSVISTRMAIEAGSPVQSHMSLVHCAQNIYRAEGWRPFFAGAGLSMATQVLPGMALAAAVAATMTNNNKNNKQYVKV